MSQELTSKDFQKKGNSYYITKAFGTGGLLVVKTEWCSFCQKLFPIIKQVSNKLGKTYPIFKLDADKNSKLTKELGVQGFPTIFYIERDGRISGQYTSSRDEGSILKGICDKSLVCRK